MNLCPFVARPHPILNKMLALSSLALMAMLLSTPARAGYWVFTCPGSSGNYTITNANNAQQSVTNWTPQGLKTGSSTWANSAAVPTIPGALPSPSL